MVWISGTLVQLGAFDLTLSRRQLMVLPRQSNCKILAAGIPEPDDALLPPSSDNYVCPAIAIHVIRQIAVRVEVVLSALVRTKRVRFEVRCGEPVWTRNDVRFPIAVDVSDSGCLLIRNEQTFFLETHSFRHSAHLGCDRHDQKERED